jgi:hypothetical protein
MIFDRCRAFDLFASVDAHLCCKAYDRGEGNWGFLFYFRRVRKEKEKRDRRLKEGERRW